MRTLTFTERNVSIGESAISSAQQELGFELPEAYREFLLRHNGGLSKECVFEIPGRGQSSIVFFGIQTGNEYTDSLANFHAYRSRVPNGVLPIGSDPGGNLVCLICEGPRAGEIYFWDHEKVDSKAHISDMYRLANSLDEFVNGLQYENNESW